MVTLGCPARKQVSRPLLLRGAQAVGWNDYLETSVAVVTLTLLGPPSVQFTEGQAIVPQPGAKVLALLTFLTLEPGSHTREELAGLLWGDSPEAEARASLRQALKHLRTILGDTVRIDRATVELAE